MKTRIKTDITSEVLTHTTISQFLKYEDNQTAENTLIDDMCKEARAHFEKVTELCFAKKTLVTYFRNDDQPFVLPWGPVISIVKVETVDIEGTAEALTLNSGYYKKGMYDVEILLEADGTFPSPFLVSGKYDLRVEYTAGYGDDDTEALPEDLKGALKKQVKQWYDNRDDFYEFNILGSIQKVLNRYKKGWL